MALKRSNIEFRLKRSNIEFRLKRSNIEFRLKRSNIEFRKRVFLDRLTTDAQALFQPADIDAGPGDQYEYAGVFDPFNFGMDADCSGADGIFVGAAVLGPTGMSWTRQFSTEAFRLAPDPNHGPFGSRRVSREELRDGPYQSRFAFSTRRGAKQPYERVHRRLVDGVERRPRCVHAQS